MLTPIKRTSQTLLSVPSSPRKAARSPSLLTRRAGPCVFAPTTLSLRSSSQLQMMSTQKLLVLTARPTPLPRRPPPES
eukprot:519718-Pleurochrysis_carterae.AAC.1